MVRNPRTGRVLPVRAGDSLKFDPVAQLVEQRPFKAKVRGSSPRWVTTSPQASYRLRRLFQSRRSLILLRLLSPRKLTGAFAGAPFYLGWKKQFCHMKSALKIPSPFRFRLRRKLHSGGIFFASNRDPLRWARGWDRPVGGYYIETRIAILPHCATPPQASYRLRRLFQSHRSLILLRPLSPRKLTGAFAGISSRSLPIRFAGFGTEGGRGYGAVT